MSCSNFVKKNSLFIFQGVTWPAILPLAANWIPPNERSKFMSNMMGIMAFYFINRHINNHINNFFDYSLFIPLYFWLYKKLLSSNSFNLQLIVTYMKRNKVY